MTQDIDLLRAELYKVTEANAVGLSGVRVVQCLKTISEEMYAAGIDEALRKTEGQIKNWDNIASAWDLTWLTLFAYKLHQIKKPIRMCGLNTKEKYLCTLKEGHHGVHEAYQDGKKLT